MKKIAPSPLDAQSAFQSPPGFLKGSVSDDGRSVDLIDAQGERQTLPLDVALLALEAIGAAERWGDLSISTPAFLRAGEATDA